MSQSRFVEKDFGAVHTTMENQKFFVAGQGATVISVPSFATVVEVDTSATDAHLLLPYTGVDNGHIITVFQVTGNHNTYITTGDQNHFLNTNPSTLGSDIDFVRLMFVKNGNSGYYFVLAQYQD